jgi:hypothetical protein
VTDLTQGFFNLIYEPDLVDESHLLSVWTLPKKRTRFHGNTEAAAKDALAECQAGNEVYFGVGLRRKGLRGGRGGAADVNVVTCLWADIDFAGIGHVDTRKVLPPSTDDARKLIHSINPLPSIAIHSGGGFHCYWLLTEAFEITNSKDLDEITLASKRWNQTIQQFAKSMFGWDVDATWDISRVLRVPGTQNRKSDVPIMVGPALQVVKRNWPDGEKVNRYELSDLIENSVDVDSLKKAAAISGRPVSPGLVLDPQASVDGEKLMALSTNDKKFAATYKAERPDMADQSLSAYDMALANAAAMAGWTDQEIANLIIQFRRNKATEKKEIEKGLRLDYITRTINAARETSSGSEAVQELARLPNITRRDASESEKESTLDIIRRALGIPIKAFVRHGVEDPDYSLVLDSGTNIALGSLDEVGNQRRFGLKVWAGHGIRPQLMKEGVWFRIMNQLAAIEILHENPETTRQGKLKNWLASYVANVVVHGSEHWWAGLNLGQPFYDAGNLWVNVDNLRQFIWHHLGDRVSVKELTGLLRHADAERKDRSHRVRSNGRDDSNKPVSRAYWRIPAEVHQPAELV